MSEEPLVCVKRGRVVILTSFVVKNNFWSSRNEPHDPLQPIFANRHRWELTPERTRVNGHADALFRMPPCSRVGDEMEGVCRAAFCIHNHYYAGNVRLDWPRKYVLKFLGALALS